VTDHAPRSLPAVGSGDDLGLGIRLKDPAPRHFYVGPWDESPYRDMAGSSAACRFKGCGRPPGDGVHLTPGGKPARVEQRQAASG